MSTKHFFKQMGTSLGRFCKKTWKWILALIIIFVVFIIGVKWYRWNNDAWWDTDLSEDVRVLEYVNKDLYCIYNSKTEKKTVDKLDWVAFNTRSPYAVVSQKGLRGYVDLKTGEIQIPPTFSKAWIFSDGIAAVADENNKLWFINTQGEQTIGKTFKADGNNSNGYVFHHNYCMMNNEDNLYGLIDRQGNWVIEPRYASISYDDCGFWIASIGDSAVILDSALRVIFPFGELYDAIFYSEEKEILVHHKTTPSQIYSFDGVMLRDIIYSGVEPLNFYEESGIDDDESYKYDIVFTGLNKYYTHNGRCGLLDASGKRLTDAIYSDFEMIGPKLIQATLYSNHRSVLLNEKGNPINK